MHRDSRTQAATPREDPRTAYSLSLRHALTRCRHVSAPQIPYVNLPELKLHFLSFLTSKEEPPSIKPFGTLVAIGVYIGSVVAVRHARQRGQDVDKMNSFIFWVVGLGFVGGHVFDAIFYTPERLSQDSLYIFKLWAGLSSFGGFLGAIIGAVAYKLSKRENILAFCDTVCSAFPLAWVFGRSGCASVHDHPGKLSSAWYAVKAPPPFQPPDPHAWLQAGGPANGWQPSALPAGMGRLDLGFIEMVLTIPLAIAFWWLWRSKPRQYGFFAGYMCVAYAPVRFVLDFLRVGPGDLGGESDPRYFGLTPAQYACVGLVFLGFLIVRAGKKSYAPVPATYEEMQESARAALLEAEEEEAAKEEGARPKTKSAVAGTLKKGAKKKKNKKKAQPKPADASAETEADAPSGDDAPVGRGAVAEVEPSKDAAEEAAVEESASAKADDKVDAASDDASKDVPGASDAESDAKTAKPKKPAKDDKTDA